MNQTDRKSASRKNTKPQQVSSLTTSKKYQINSYLERFK